MAHFAIENLSFRYPAAAQPALRGVSLAVKRGSFTVVCGRSGSGKTTLLRHLKSVLAPHGSREGRVLLEGRPLDEVPLGEQARRIGFVMQDPDAQLVSDKVWHELAFGLENLGVDEDVMRARVAETATFLGIHSWLHADVRELSGGQKQLLNLASVMAVHPDVLVLDEPTSQLDPMAAIEFLTTLRRLNEELGTTVVLTEHRLEEVCALADRVVVMEGGVVAADGPVREVGRFLHEHGSDMARAMPTPVRAFCAVEGAAGGSQPCPVSVREGRAWLSGRSASPVAAPLPSECEPVGAGGGRVEALSVDDAWFRYGRDCPDVLRGASLSAYEGEILAIMGGNGAGKSTLLSLMCGVERPYRGSVRVLGRKVSARRADRRLDARVSMLAQDPQNLFVKQSVRDDLAEMLADVPDEAERARRIDEVARALDVEDVLEAHPFDLSGGELQRAALAKVLLTRPRVLLLDEPTKGIDALLKEKLAEVLRKIARQGVAIVMVSHDVEFCARHADRVALLFDGAISSEGTPRSIFASNAFYTTAASRMSRHVCAGAVTVEDVIALLGKG